MNWKHLLMGTLLAAAGIIAADLLITGTKMAYTSLKG